MTFGLTFVIRAIAALALSGCSPAKTLVAGQGKVPNTGVLPMRASTRTTAPASPLGPILDCETGGYSPVSFLGRHLKSYRSSVCYSQIDHAFRNASVRGDYVIISVIMFSGSAPYSHEDCVVKPWDGFVAVEPISSDFCLLIDEGSRVRILHNLAVSESMDVFGMIFKEPQLPSFSEKHVVLDSKTKDAVFSLPEGSTLYPCFGSTDAFNILMVETRRNGRRTFEVGLNVLDTSPTRTSGLDGRLRLALGAVKE